MNGQNENTVKVRKRSLKYCCVCSGIYRGMIKDGRKVSLHRFPQNKRLKRVWIQRCKIVMKEFKWNEHKLLCSEHFIDQAGPTPIHTLPSKFPSLNGSMKIFATSKLDENQLVPEFSDIEEPLFVATPLNSDLDLARTSSSPTHESVHENDQPEDGPLFTSKADCSLIDISLQLHDYCEGPVLPANPLRNIGTQTCLETSDQMTETKNDVKQFVDMGTQTETPSTKDAGEQTKLPTLVYEDVMNSDSDLMFYTGVPNKLTFDALFEEMDDALEKTSDKKLGKKKRHVSGGRPRTIRIIDEVFMVLMRLRLGLLVSDLAQRFCISNSACGRVLNRWIDYLDVKLNFLITWPSKQVVNYNMPKLFRDKFAETSVIIDCTEIRTETPSSLQLKSLMYSNYKSHNTWKTLVGISPSGHVTFVSDLWTGSVSDKQITQQSGLVELCEDGDAIMADKGFLISDLTTPKGIKLIIPPFKKANVKFTKSEVKSTRAIANARIHVEREMERIKNFRILQGVMPIRMSNRASKVWKLCAKLTNLQPPSVPH